MSPKDLINPNVDKRFPATSNGSSMNAAQSTIGNFHEPFVELEPNSLNEHMNHFQSICFMPEFRNFSYEVNIQISKAVAV
jgi:hypothetical protein